MTSIFNGCTPFMKRYSSSRKYSTVWAGGMSKTPLAKLPIICHRTIVTINQNYRDKNKELYRILLILIEPDSEKPIYQQIRDQIVEGIAKGELQEGSSLPSIRQLASDFGINLHTVNKAYELLEREGFLQLKRKTGAVIHIKER